MITNREAFFKKLGAVLMSQRFQLTLVFILVSIFGSDAMVKDREEASKNIVEAIQALVPLGALLVGYLSLMVSYTKSPTLGKEFFNRISDSALLVKVVELIDVIKPLLDQTDEEPPQ